jgi:hypothetical protein
VGDHVGIPGVVLFVFLSHFLALFLSLLFYPFAGREEGGKEDREIQQVQYESATYGEIRRCRIPAVRTVSRLPKVDYRGREVRYLPEVYWTAY